MEKNDPSKSSGADDLKLPRGKGRRRDSKRPALPDEETRVRQGVAIVVVVFLVLAGSLLLLARGCGEAAPAA